MNHTSYIELSRSALKQNFDYIRKTVGDECMVSHVVKGNAYGHGIDTFVPLAVELGAKHFSTFDANEAHEVFEITNGQTPVMIMGMIDDHQVEWAVKNGVEFYVFEIGRLKAAIDAAHKTGKKAKVHVELETGMNRTGFEERQLNDLQKLLKQEATHIELKGFCTHYAGAESYANFLRVNEQYETFEKRVGHLNANGIQAEKHHTACSAASIRMPHTQMDLVRIGILQYGFWPSTETYIQTIKPNGNLTPDPLKRVISWKSQVMNIKHVKQGEYIGYGTSYLATSDIKVATVPVGYGHGFSRSLSNQGRALVRGMRVTVVGIVNMNMMMLDVSGIDNVERGDEVVMIGTQGDLSISVSSFSEYSDQLNYELLTRLPHDIPRRVVD